MSFFPWCRFLKHLFPRCVKPLRGPAGDCSKNTRSLEVAFAIFTAVLSESVCIAGGAVVDRWRSGDKCGSYLRPAVDQRLTSMWLTGLLTLCWPAEHSTLSFSLLLRPRTSTSLFRRTRYFDSPGE